MVKKGALALVAMLLPVVAYAQATSSITGRVVDTDGAVLPGVAVTVTSTATGVARDTFTNAQGLFNVPALNPGIYNVRAELTGFAPRVRENVQVLTGATMNVELQLGLASLQESITVSAAAPLVEATQSSIASSIRQQEVVALPMINRSMAA
ncbi:MAG: carboxypeptidase-like regulatory domain-containing protein, partial [Vicinamibacterales bacterium]